MENIQKVHILIFLFFIFCAINSNIAQWNFNLGTSQSFNNNPFNYPEANSSFISSVDFGIEHQISTMGFGYYGNYTSFNTLSDRNFYWHQFGLWNSTDSSMYGFYVEQRMNKSIYDYYNFTDYNAYHKYLFMLSDFYIFTNVAISFTDYYELDDLDNLFAKVGVSVNKSFNTKTTIIGGINYNYKNYISSDLNNYDLVGDSLRSSSSHSFNNQLNFYLRASQSLGENTGLAVQYSIQNILGSTASFTRKLEYIYGDESQYFNDPTSFEGYSFSILLTQILPEEIIFRTIYSYGEKDYPSHGIFLDQEHFNSEIIRTDNQSTFSATLSKQFDVGSEDQNTISLSLDYNWLDNNSNSYWYNFDSRQIDFTLEYQF